MGEAGWVVLGVAVGAGLVLAVVVFRRRSEAGVAQELIRAAEREKLADLDRIIAQLKESFGSLSRDALSANQREFLELAQTRLKQETIQGAQTLEEKKKLIDASLEAVKGKFTELNALITRLEADRLATHGQLSEKLQNVTQTAARLQETTGNLHKALAGTQSRGQWGERMADDVIRHAGLQEGINYTRQTQTDGSRPDFTFFLPGSLRVNMDVKFPLSNYLRSLEAPDPAAADAACKTFLRDVRGRIREVTSRAYIDPAGGTLDYVLVFIPNERVYAFIHEHDPDLLDEAMRSKVVLCSPLTLYAVLAVIRQSVDNFRLEEVSNEIHRLLLEFRKQWEAYVREMDKIGAALEKAKEAYDAVVTTRTRMLERQLDKIDTLSEERLLPGADAANP